jgi:hypothetical protein
LGIEIELDRELEKNKVEVVLEMEPEKNQLYGYKLEVILVYSTYVTS